MSDHDPIPIGSVEELQALADPSDGDFPLDGEYVLTSDLDLSGVSDFRPIGKTNVYGDDDVFTGVFDGDGHAIRNLTTEDTRNAGVFGLVGSDGVVKNVAVEDADVSAAYFGGESAAPLVGQNDGTVRNASATGVVDAPLTSGGLVGENRGTVEESTATVEVLSAGQRGGLVGRNEGTVRSSSASGDVGLGADSDERSGGLVALNSGTVTDSEASGDVDGSVSGGLVARNTTTGTVQSASATGDVTGSISGGIAGDNSGTVEESYATGVVTGGGGAAAAAGGVVGRNDGGGTVRLSYATGAVTSGNYSGGVVGDAAGTVEAVYATGGVGGSSAGGIAGRVRESGVVGRAYAAGSVGGNTVGGLVGNNGGTVEDVYWDVTTAGTETAVDRNDGPTETLVGLSTSEMQGSTARRTLSELDFGSTWVTLSGDYPTLTVFDSREASLSIRNLRLVQRVENTRIGQSTWVNVTARPRAGSELDDGLRSYEATIRTDGATIRSVVPETLPETFEVTDGGVGESFVTVAASEPDTPVSGDVTGTVLFRIEVSTPEHEFKFKDIADSSNPIDGITLTDSDGTEYGVRIGFTEGPDVVTDGRIGDSPDADGTPDPPLVAGVNTAPVFDLSGPEDVELTEGVDVTVFRDDEEIGTCTLRAQAVERAVAWESLLAQLEQGRSIVAESSYPVFEAVDGQASVTVDVSVREEGISGDTAQVTVGEDESDDFRVESLSKPLTVGFVAVDNRSEKDSLPYEQIGNWSGFSGTDRESAYETTVEEGVKYASKVVPTDRVVAYVHDIDDGVQAEATVEDAEFYEKPFVTELTTDQEAARTRLQQELDAGNVTSEPTNGGILIASGGEAETDPDALPDPYDGMIDEFDVTVGIVPHDYLTKLDPDVPHFDARLEDGTVTLTMTNKGTGVANEPVTADGTSVGQTDADGTVTFALPDEDEFEVVVDQNPKDEESNYLTYGVENGSLVEKNSTEVAGKHLSSDPQARTSVFVAAGISDRTTVVHEAGHHFVGDPFEGDLARTPDDGDPNPAHSTDRLISTKFDLSDGTLDSRSVAGSVPSYMSYASESKWADSLTTRKLVDSNGPFEPTPEEDSGGSSSGNSLFAVAAITSSGIEFLTRRVRSVDAKTDGSEGATVTVSDGDGGRLAEQTLPTRITATSQQESSPGGTLVAENLIVGDIDFPEQTAEVEVSAPAPDDDGGDTVTTTTDTTDPVVADFTPGAATVGDPVTFDARSSFSTDPDGAVERYEWDWTDDGEFETDTTASKTTHTYAAEGSYDVTLRVTDDDGTTATLTRTVEVGVGGGDDGEESTDAPGITLADFVGETSGVERGDVPEEVVDRINDALEGTNPELYGASEGDGGDGGTGDT